MDSKKTDQTSRTAITGLLGIARRAGKLTTGFDAVIDLVRQNKAALVLLSSDLSDKTAKELRFTAKEHPVPIVRLPLTKEETGRACGLKKPVGVLATVDAGFGAAMEKHCQHDTEEEPAI